MIGSSTVASTTVEPRLTITLFTRPPCLYEHILRPKRKITEFTLHNRFYLFFFFFIFALFTYSLHWNFTLFRYLTEQCQK